LQWLDVLNYAVGGSEDFTITDGGNSDTLTETTDFSAVTSNTVTALNIAIAWNTVSRLDDMQIRAIPYGEKVAFVRLTGTSSFTISTSNASAWDEVSNAYPTQWYFSSSTGAGVPSPLQATDEAGTPVLPVIDSVDGLVWEHDPIDRKTKPPSIEFTLSRDEDIRHLAQFFQLRRNLLEIFIGEESLASFANFSQIAQVHIEDIVPQKGRVVITGKDAMGDVWRHRGITGAWVAWHPLQIIEDILTDAGASDGVHYTASTLDPSQDLVRSHFVLSRYWDGIYTERKNGIYDEIPAGELIEELITLMYGLWRPTQTGPYEYIPWDGAAASVRTWTCGQDTGHHVDEVEQLTSLGGMANSVKVTFARHEQGRLFSYSEGDAHSFIESGGLVSEIIIRTNWLTGIGRTNFVTSLYQHGSNHGTGEESIWSDTEKFPVSHAGRQGFCGNQWEDSTGVPLLVSGMAMGQVGEERYCILQVTGTNVSNIQRTEVSGSPIDEVEYILVDRWQLADNTEDGFGSSGNPSRYPTPTDGFVPGPLSSYCSITTDTSATNLPNNFTIGEWYGAGVSPDNAGRGALGTTMPANWQQASTPLNNFEGIWVRDFTIPVYLVKDLINRFRNGAPRCAVRTNLSQIDVELGEFVALSGDDQIIAHLRNGVDTDVIWEVTKKEIDITGDSPGVSFELTFVRDDSQFMSPVSGRYIPTPVINLDLPVVVVPREPVTDGGITVTDSSLTVYD